MSGPARRALRLALLRGIGSTYPKPRGGHRPESVLLIRPDHLGDVLLLTPALAALRRALPEARLTLLAGPWSEAVARGCRDVDALEICPFPGFERRPKGNPLAPYRLLFAAAERLRGRFDTAVVLRYDHWWGAWLAAAAGIPRRIGYRLPETAPFLTEALPYKGGRHETRQNARLLEALAPGIEDGLGPTRFEVSTEDREWAAGQLGAGHAGHGRKRVAIHPGAGAAVKQWPAEKWAAVADALADEFGAQIVLTAGPGERELTSAVAAQAHARCIDLAGQTTLGQLAAVYSQCDLVLGSDSGPLHLAVAAEAKTVHLYGPVPPAKFGPWGDPARNVVLASPFGCAPCDRLDWPAHELRFHGCIPAIEVGAVIDAAVGLLDEQERG